MLDPDRRVSKLRYGEGQVRPIGDIKPLVLALVVACPRTLTNGIINQRYRSCINGKGVIPPIFVPRVIQDASVLRAVIDHILAPIISGFDAKIFLFKIAELPALSLQCRDNTIFSSSHFLVHSP